MLDFIDINSRIYRCKHIPTYIRCEMGTGFVVCSGRNKEAEIREDKWEEILNDGGSSLQS